MSNADIARVLAEMGLLLEMDGVQFKPRAYEKVAESIETLQEDVAAIFKRGGMEALMRDIPGVGKGIAEHIEELLKKGTFREYATLKKKVPVDITGLTAVEGVGPKAVKVLWEKLKIKNLSDLERAARAGKIRALPHFGEQSEKKILKGIEFLKASGGRKVLGHILPEICALEKTIQGFPGVQGALVAGSVRRRKETIGDIDILVVSQKPETVMEKFVKMPKVAHVYAHGPTKTLVRLKNGLDADMRVVPRESFGAALNYFTGSKDHNVALRRIAIERGLKLNEYGLFQGKKQIAGETEEDLYEALGLHYIEPELREHRGEIDAARENKLPRLIEYRSLKGDLQVQTDWTDGKHSIEEMARAAEKAGLTYIAVTDHTKTLAMTGGADEKKLERQMEEIDRINKMLHASGSMFYVLKGAEVNILKDGALDINDATLAKLDVVGAAVHSHFDLPEAEQTARVICAMENPHVDILFHPTGRVIGRREPIQLDMDEIIKAAQRTGTLLEVDAFPDRSDLKDEHIRKCVEAGVKMTIDSDAHAAPHFAFLEHGVAQARRGWATRADIANAWPLEKFLTFLKHRH